jgi:hypothetical protein
MPLRLRSIHGATKRKSLRRKLDSISNDSIWSRNLGSPLMHFASTSLSPSWNKMLKLERGATLDVVVGHSPDSFLFDNTPLTLVITKQ